MDLSPLNATSTAEEASRVIKASEGTLFRLSVYNNNAASRFIQLFDSASVPADATVPAAVYEVATQTTRVIDFGTNGRKFSTGIAVCNSTTDTTKTLGAADSLFDAQYI